MKSSLKEGHPSGNSRINLHSIGKIDHYEVSSNELKMIESNGDAGIMQNIAFTSIGIFFSFLASFISLSEIKTFGAGVIITVMIFSLVISMLLFYFSCRASGRIKELIKEIRER